MTARARLDRRVRWVMVPATAGILLFMAAVVASQVAGAPALAAVGLPGFAVAFAAGMVGHFVAFRCPSCRGNLAPLAFGHAAWRFSPRVQFCPYCGTDLDAELPAAGPAT